MEHTIPPWYKQFWPWFLILVPVLTMIMSFNLLRLAVETKDSLVVDDYYEKGKAINLQLDKIHQAQKLDIFVTGKMTRQRIALKIHARHPLDGTAILLGFHHATLAERDFTMTVPINAVGIYSAPVTHDIKGKWLVTIQPFDKQWKVQKKLQLPQAGELTIEP